MRKQQCDNPRYDTTIEIKPLNGPRPPPTQLCGGNPKMSDGTIGRFGTMTLGRAGSLPGSFGGRPTENRTRSYYRSNWDSDESIVNAELSPRVKNRKTRNYAMGDRAIIVYLGLQGGVTAL
ncbi:Hypp2925 [Branchiostoma lanceolatum]|uniref:Hypp2925 protein n=1 Tax=Branchiostoma lanceolatum TaxID=7740 RepID=A0A8J9ZVR9_BRALA|nr:Hypp2925 [Branchiostoma lanceolatum]